MILTIFNNGSVRKEKIVETAFKHFNGDQPKVNAYLKMNRALHGKKTALEMAEESHAQYEKALRILSPTYA